MDYSSQHIPYKRIDLHIHTTHSSCYDTNMEPEAGLVVTPADIVESAVAKGLDAIAITDHNTAEAIDAIRKEAASTRLVIFPGMEVTAKGGHTLAIFDPQTPSDRLRELLAAIGLTEKDRGEGYCQTNLWMDELAQRIAEFGGLAIAAHVDRSYRGFVASNEPLADKMRIHACPFLSALEITVAEDKALWNNGEMRHYPKKYACIQGSDAHAPAEMGRRTTFLRVPELNLNNLRLAFSEYSVRIRFPEEVPCEGKMIP
ncbi:MAG: PHP domain-containing protein [Dehalococcoidia bacterium]|nr:PHP domain-containing protein [Dehalococcoidia bacterium]